MKKIIVAMILVLALSLGWGECSLAQAQDLSGSLYQQGLQLFHKKDFAGAVDYLGQVCDMVDTHHEARYYLIFSLTSLRRYREALLHAETLVQQKPDEERYQKVLAQVQEIIGGSKKTTPPPKNEPSYLTTNLPRVQAYQSLTIATRTRETPPAAKPPASTTAKPLSLFEQGIQELDLQNFASAAVLFDEVLKKEKDNPKALHFRGVVEYQQGQYSQARGFFEKALKIDPKAYDTLFLVGDSYLKDSKFAEAETAFANALKVKEDPYAQINLAETKRALGRPDEAIDLLKKVLEKNAGLTEARIYMTEAYLDKNELETAAEEINNVLSQDPQNSLARFVKAKVLYQGNLLEDAALSVKQALVLSPGNRLFEVFHAQILLKMNRYNDAIEIAGKLINTDANHWEARLVLAQAFMQSGDAQTAQEHLNNAAQTVSGPEITLLDARIARKLGDNDRALAVYQTYFSQDSNAPQVYMEYAEFLESLGDNETAGDIYQQVKERFPDTPFAVAAESKLAATLKPGTGTTPPAPPAFPPPAVIGGPPKGKRGEY